MALLDVLPTNAVSLSGVCGPGPFAPTTLAVLD
jgi:hypothetical protein